MEIQEKDQDKDEEDIETLTLTSPLSQQIVRNQIISRKIGQAEYIQGKTISTESKVESFWHTDQTGNKRFLNVENLQEKDRNVKGRYEDV